MKNPAGLIILFMFTVTSFSATDYRLAQQQYTWDFEAMKTMDSLGLWCGGNPGDISISRDCIEGSGSIQTKIDLDKNEFLRIEHLFLNGFADVGFNLHGLNIREQDLTGINTISFSCKTDLNRQADLVFRLCDTYGHWMEWKIDSIHNVRHWKSFDLDINLSASPINMTQINSVTFEIQAGDKPLTGTINLDDLRFQNEPGRGIRPVTLKTTYAPYQNAIHSIPAPSMNRNKEVHILMFCDTIKAFNHFDADKAISILKESVSRFRGMPNMEFWFLAAEFNWGHNLTPEQYNDHYRKLAQTLITVANWCEKNRVPFYVGSGHILPIVIKEDVMDEVLKTAPTYCKGVFLHEFSPEDNNQTQDLFGLLEICRKYNKVVILNNQTCYWFSQMLNKNTGFRTQLYSEQYKDVFIPMWENLLPASQGMCLGNCLGLWRSGSVSNWGVSCQSWTYTNLNFGLTDQMPDHWWLRMFVSSVAFGATYIEIEPDWPFNGKHTIYQERDESGYLLKLDEQNTLPFYEDSREMKALRWFSRLLANDALLPAQSPKHQVSLPDVALQVHSDKNHIQAGVLQRATDEIMNQSYCPTAWDMMCQPSRSNLFRRLYRSQQHYDQTFPITSMGLVSILPPENPPHSIKRLQTDGYGLLQDGKWLSPEDSEPIIYQAFAKAAKSLPFTAENCTLSAIKLNKNDYQVVMMDPEERFPVGVETRLNINLSGKWNIYDAVNGTRIASKKKRIPLTIEPAGIRILRIRKD